MFTSFFYLLRARGLKVSLNEWMSLIEALDKGLHGSSFTGFYYLCRSVLVKSEADFDKFDGAFLEFFKDMELTDELPQELLDWLENPKEKPGEEFDMDRAMQNEWLSQEEIQRMFLERLQEQKEEHNGGSYWVGTGGVSVFGNSGFSPRGIRVGGEGGQRRAFQVAGERKFRDFRDDNTLDIRQFQMAFRKLRQFSSRLDIPETELDINGTVDKTCNNGGCLQIVMQKPRKNAVKLLLLMDSGGTMIPFSSLLNDLFQAIHKSNHYKDVKTYYFHNCIYSKLYKTPECENGDWVDTEWMFRNVGSDYKVIIVGDAAMAPEELYSDTGNYRGPNGGLSGYEWLQLMKKKYKKVVWLNPKMAPGRAPWREAETAVKELFPMYKLTVDGLNQAMVKLMANR